MLKKQYILAPNTLQSFKKQLYAYANSFATSVCLDSNQTTAAFGYNSYEIVAGIGAKATIQLTSAHNAFAKLHTFYTQHNGWLLGYFGYDLKNDVENLHSANADALVFPTLYFFVPQTVVTLAKNCISIEAENPDEVYHSIFSMVSNDAYAALPSPNFVPKISKQQYLEKVQQVRKHIEEGDVYELNLCMEFLAFNCVINPLEVYTRLLQISPVPFAAFAKFENTHFALCASPERFLKKEGAKLISQPIKGTAKRGNTNQEDEELKKALCQSEKEMAENVMIVDLVRNDLARTCKTGSVQVEELFGVYTFPQVHQMISTITGELNNHIHFFDAIASAFPMGSMTGAPKVKAMELIELYEESKRGLFSGSIGYIEPNGNFDFNVMIRSLLYNANTQLLSYQVGGAITYDSVPEDEYNECMLKALAIVRLWKE